MIDIHWLPVDEYEPHTPLEGWGQALTVHGWTAWMERTHDANFSSLSSGLAFQYLLKKVLYMYLNIANMSSESSNLQNKSCLLFPVVPTVQLARLAHCPQSE